MAVWTGDIKTARTIGVPVGGGKASARIVANTTPPEIQFKRNRGAGWPADSDAKPVGNLDGSLTKTIELLQVPGHITLIITDCADLHWISTNDGESWDALATL